MSEPPSSAAGHDPRALAPARQQLREVFGYDAFLPGQAEIVASVLARRDTLAVLPTGGGKSVCYQIPALLLDGLTVVVSPLLALMKDQVDALTRNGVSAAAVNSTVPREEQGEILRRAAGGDLRLLYVAPERFSDGRFIAAMRSVNVALLAVDEAHCISQWGHDFRPDYRDLGAVRARLDGPPIVALTATADPLVRGDIAGRLGLREPAIHVAGFDRPNLRFYTVRVRSQKEKLERIVKPLGDLGSEASAIIYCSTRKKVESLAADLRSRGVDCAPYHAGMSDEERDRIQDAFAQDRLRIIVATNAFGLGIDKPDVRVVIHHDLPESIEAYYQEAGRAGRDGDPAECVLYFAPRDRDLREFFIELNHPPPATVIEVYRALVRRGGQRALIDDLLDSEEETPGVNAAVQALVDSGLAQRQGEFARALRPDGEDEIDLAGLEAHRAHATAKLDTMQSYAESTTCLRARVLAYFGEADGRRTCGNCGPCLASTRRRPADKSRSRPSQPRGHGPPQGSASYETKDEPAPKPMGGPESADDPLFAELRALGRQLAKEEGVPPYIIFNDATLHDMVSQRPATGVALARVRGVGRAKTERYGHAFLTVIRAAPRAEGDDEQHLRAYEPWESDEEARLLSMHKGGETIKTIAAELQRRPAAIRSRLRRLLGEDVPESRRLAVEPAVPRAESDQEPDRTPASRDTNKRLAAIRRQHPRAYKPWAPNEEARLLALQQRDESVETIARELQRQPSAIRSRLRRLLGEDAPS
ncbi:MAG: ATP-dependent DNA helicase [Chloroflexi bacterium]|nr:ATP-dependent DNA helicase [Chloroflexota bacterium]